VPPGFSELAEKASEAPETVAGWSFTERTAKFDGKLVPVSPSRLKLLRVLVEAEGPLSGKMIAELAFGKHMGEDAARYHITSLRKELGEAFPEFEGEFIPGDGGYRVAMR
ncbi:MAG: helix-turn-helix domain-containing protein, partial [Planctomycetes bacterium]|nr:helix-turn-helix domain-containing protein [Planctomycetota bacterium]